MPDEVGTEANRSDAASADDSLFGDAPDGRTAADTEEEDANEEATQDPQGSDGAGEQNARTEAAEDERSAEEAGEETASDDLKVVMSIKGGRAVIGVQRPSADPHIETFDGRDLTGLAQEVVAVAERARERWEETPKHPAYERPAPPAGRRNRRGQGAAQATPAETEQAQQQTLRLF